MKSNKNSNKKNNALFPIACIALCILVLLLIFLVKKDDIFTNLKKTDFFGRIFGATPTVIENHEVSSEEVEIPLKEDIVINVEPEIKEEIIPMNKEIEENIEENNEHLTKEPEKVTKEDKIKENSKKQSTTQLELCFVMIGGEGSVIRKPVKRIVEKNDSPLTTAINLLLAGPDKANKNEANCMTLIPEGSKLLSAKVSNGVAYLNFNEAFEFNHIGIEGYIHQLEQVVYTATAFPTVTSVQFLIEGKEREYLGEGQWIGSPLSRGSF